ncbi:hypothetical protein [Nocardioides gilvus]|uniref:hypothetical protein n=1 Tax=Nocardioides gilvus TaxID=1735589 RepID=UPI000D746CDA|nr:hypothetical protein [Nocardioides gilvus]
MGDNDRDGTEQVTGVPRALQIPLYVILALGVLFALVFIDASIGHDGLHCELGFVLSDKDDACGGFWR